MFNSLITTIFGALLFVVAGNAQTTGSFDLTIDFNESDYDYTRQLYFYVPADYDSTRAYKLVVGFRGGPHSNAGQFRDQLTFLADSIDAIILCPENSAHFNTDEGLTKQLFEYSVDTAATMYHIDRDFIYLTGLSYGGRHAVIVAMDTDNGPIPGLRGVIPFATGQNGHLQPDYEAVAEFAPACVCIGLNDNATFKNVANTLHNDIVDNGGASLLNEIPGVGHTVAFPTYPDEMMECLAFIESQYETSSTSGPRRKTGSVELYPNPASLEVMVEITASTPVRRLYISDASGRILRDYITDERRLDLRDLPQGVLVLTVVTDNDVIARNFVKN